MPDRETNAQPGVPDVTSLLFEIDDVWCAMHHGRNGVQPDVDPVRESERLAAAWHALDAFARRAFPDAK